MYLDYYGLKELPFSIAPDPRYLYMSERHREALAHLLYGVNGQGGFVVLTGEVGTGKTTICRCFLHQVPKNTDVAYVVNPKLSARELLATICDELKVPYADGASIKALNDHINAYLLQAHADNRHTVLIIDEAQNLRVDVLEQLRLLTNLETSEKKLLQIILLGQPELREMLGRQELRQLNQRVTARYHLQALNRVEVGAYLQCRLAVAGCKHRLFTMAAVNRLYKISGGVPRLINLIADRALLGAYAAQSEQVEKSHIQRANNEMQGADPKAIVRQTLVRSGMVAAVVSVLVAGGAALQLFSEREENSALAQAEISSTSVVDSTNAAAMNAEPVELSRESGRASVPLVVGSATETAKAHPTIEEFEEALSSDAGEILAHAQAETPDTRAGASLDVAAPKHALPLESEPFLQTLGKRQNSRFAKLRAFQAVFERWNINYAETPFSLACDFAETQGLRCLHKQGNWRSLLRLDRPAVLTLFNEDGDQFHIALLQIREDRGEVDFEGQRFWVSLDEIDRYWLGEYSVLWRLPPYKTQRINPGQLDEDAWLSQHLDTLLSRTTTQSRAPVQVPNSVSEKVKHFQRHVGLVPDGIAGSMTIIHINNMLGFDCPTLMGKS